MIPTNTEALRGFLLEEPRLSESDKNLIKGAMPDKCYVCKNCGYSENKNVAWCGMCGQRPTGDEKVDYCMWFDTSETTRYPFGKKEHQWKNPNENT